MSRVLWLFLAAGTDLWPGVALGQNVRIVGQIGGYCRAVCVSGNYAYIGDGPSLAILNISNPASPVCVGRILLYDEIQSIYASGGFAYVADYRLEIVDVRNPAQPRLVSSYDTSDAAFDVYVANNLAYVADRYSGLQIIGVSNPSAPVRRGFYNTPGESYGVWVSGNYAYVADGPSVGGPLKIIDVSDPTRPVLRGSGNVRGYPRDVVISGGRAYIAYSGPSWSGLQISNVSDPTSPTTLGHYDTTDAASGIFVAGTLAYVAAGSNGLRILNVSNPSAPSLVGTFWTGGKARAVTVSGTRAYVGDDWKDLQIVNVATPGSPALLGSYTTPGDAQGVRVSGGIAYVADQNTGLYTIDIGNPTNPRVLGRCQTPGQGWNVAVNNRYAYVAARTGGLHVIDLLNPASPTLVRTCTLVGEAYAVQVVGNRAYVGHGTYAMNAGLQVYDLAIPSSPTTRAVVTLPDEAKDVYVADGYAYVAADWSGLQVVDVRNPNAPALLGSYKTNRNFDGVWVSGNVVYAAEWNGSLRVLDVSRPSSPTLLVSVTPAGGAVCVSGGYAWLDGNGLEVYDVKNPWQPVRRGQTFGPSDPEGIHVVNGLAYAAVWQGGLWILQYVGDAPRIQAATLSDVNVNGVIEANDQLVLTLDRSVTVNTAVLRASHFFLPVAADSLGRTGFQVRVNPYNARQIVLTLGQGVRLRASGVFSTGTLASGSPSGIDFATSIPFGAIASLDGISAVDRGAPGVDDAGVDIELSLVRQLRGIGPPGGSVTVVNSTDAAYRRHRLTVPAKALATTTTFDVRPPVQNLGVIGAVQIAPDNPSVAFGLPAVVQLEYRDGDVDRERGRLESEMRVHQMVENPVGVLKYVPVPGVPTLDRIGRLVSVPVANLNPCNSLATPRIFAGLPIETVDERTILVKPGTGAPSRSAPPAVLTAGLNGAYTLHKIVVPDYEIAAASDPGRLTMKIRTATLAERVSLCGSQSFPTQSGAIFTVAVTDASSRPVQFTARVHLTIQFKNRPDFAETDVAGLGGQPGIAENMRLVCDRFSDDAVGFAFAAAPSQSVNSLQGTLTVNDFVGLTGADGLGTFGAVALIGVTPAGRWQDYR
jgi:hypothetical protein